MFSFDFESTGSIGETKIESVWKRMKSESVHAISTENDAINNHIFNSIILNFSTLHASLSNLLATQFASLIPYKVWMELFSELLFKNVKYDVVFEESVLSCMVADMEAILERDPAAHSFINIFLNFKGFKALQSHRIAHILWKSDRKHAALLIQSRCSELFGIDIHPNATLGPGLVLDHGTGVVIGETARVGRQCHFLHGVTLGSRELSGAFNKKKLQSTFSTSQMSEPTLFPLDPAISTTATNSVVARHPSIGDYVMIGCNACILGNISVGDYCKIGAASVVLKSIPKRCNAVGSPAYIIGSSTNNQNHANKNTRDVDDVKGDVAVSNSTAMASPSLLPLMLNANIPDNYLTSNNKYLSMLDSNNHVLDSSELYVDTNSELFTRTWNIWSEGRNVFMKSIQGSLDLDDSRLISLEEAYQNWSANTNIPIAEIPLEYLTCVHDYLDAGKSGSVSVSELQKMIINQILYNERRYNFSYEI